MDVKGFEKILKIKAKALHTEAATRGVLLKETLAQVFSCEFC